jgi:hypothetical protein
MQYNYNNINNMDLESNKKEIQEHFNQLHKTTREFTSFLNLIIEETLQKLPADFTPTYIRCHKEGCKGIISTMVDFGNDEICWKCSDCESGGNIKNTIGSDQK